MNIKNYFSDTVKNFVESQKNTLNSIFPAAKSITDISNSLWQKGAVLPKNTAIPAAGALSAAGSIAGLGTKATIGNALPAATTVLNPVLAQSIVKDAA